jgi:glycosyltransferase involved in cell wall biosynthesis
MNILFAADYYPPFAPGGAQWTSAASAEALARRGHRVVVVTPNYGAAGREERDGVVVTRFPFPVRLPPGQQEARWLLHRNPVVGLYFAWWIWRGARRIGADVIHAQTKGALVPAWLAGRLANRPIVATVRDLAFICPIGACTLFEPWSSFDCSWRQYRDRCVPYFERHYRAGARSRALRWLSQSLAWLDNRVRQRALAGMDAIVAVSAATLALHPARLIGQRGRVLPSLPPMVPASETAASAARRELDLGQEPIVLYAGKLSHGKGTEVLLEALDRIRAQAGAVRFVFAGKGEIELPQRADVRALGSIPQATLFRLYQAADVVVVPSIWPEPRSRVVLEAMHFGRAVVATAVGGTPELIEPEVSGLLVRPGDPVALGDAVAALLRDPVRRRTLGTAAAARATRAFDEDDVTTRLLDIYRDVIGRPA